MHHLPLCRPCSVGGFPSHLQPPSTPAGKLASCTPAGHSNHTCVTSTGKQAPTPCVSDNFSAKMRHPSPCTSFVVAMRLSQSFTHTRSWGCHEDIVRRCALQGSSGAAGIAAAGSAGRGVLSQGGEEDEALSRACDLLVANAHGSLPIKFIEVGVNCGAEVQG